MSFIQELQFLFWHLPWSLDLTTVLNQSHLPSTSFMPSTWWSFPLSDITKPKMITKWGSRISTRHIRKLKTSMAKTILGNLSTTSFLIGMTTSLMSILVLVTIHGVGTPQTETRHHLIQLYLIQDQINLLTGEIKLLSLQYKMHQLVHLGHSLLLKSWKLLTK